MLLACLLALHSLLSDEEVLMHSGLSLPCYGKVMTWFGFSNIQIFLASSASSPTFAGALASSLGSSTACC